MYLGRLREEQARPVLDLQPLDRGGVRRERLFRDAAQFLDAAELRGFKGAQRAPGARLMNASCESAKHSRRCRWDRVLIEEGSGVSTCPLTLPSFAASREPSDHLEPTCSTLAVRGLKKVPDVSMFGSCLSRGETE